MFKLRESFIFAAVFAAVLLIAPSKARALPQDGSVSAGGATVSSSGQTMDITQSTTKAIINWGSFSIASGESVNFTQPTTSSIALNRVIGADASFLNGALNANGGVYLLNPNGIIIGSGASVNVSSFLASTMNISDNDFLSGNYNFSEANGTTVASVVNNGLINASGGDVVLSAPSVTNTGVVSATLGKVFIGAGEQMVLTFNGDSIFGFVVDSATLGGASVDNSGTISANGGEVYITAKSAYNAVKSVVNNSGVIEANAIVNDGGVIRLTGDVITNSGSISANAADNGTAGDISVIANDTLTLASGSVVSASGADVNSNGGNIYLYSYGNAVAEAGQLIDISGGATSGSGGSGEMSATGNVAFDGKVDGSAPGGQAGSFVIDPATATVSGVFTANTTVWAENEITITGDVTLDTTSNAVTLNLLADHANATPGTWDATVAGTGAILNDVITPFTISKTGGNTATLNMYAGTDGSSNAIGTSTEPIIVDGLDLVTAMLSPNIGDPAANIYIVSPTVGTALIIGNITGSVAVPSNLNLISSGSLTQLAGTSIQNISSLSADTTGGTGVISLNRDSVADSVTLATNNANITYSSTAALYDIVSISAGTGTVTLTSTGAVTQSGPITASKLALLGLGGVYTLDNATNNVTTLAANTGTASFTNSALITVGTVGILTGATVSGNLTLIADNMDFTSGAGTVKSTGAAGALVLEPLTAATTIGLAGGAGVLNLDATDVGAITGFSTVTIGNATSGAIEVGGTLNLATADLTLISGDAVTDTASGAITANLLTVNAGAGITLTAGTNDVASIKFTETSGGGVSYSDASGVTIAGIDAVVGVGAVSITALGAVGQGLNAGEEILCGQLTINTSSALSTAGITVKNVLNDATAIDLRSGVDGDIYYVDASTFNITTQVNAGTGLASLISGGDLIISAPLAGVTAGSLEIGAKGNVTVSAGMTGLSTPTTITAGYSTGLGALTINSDVSTGASHALTLNGETVVVNAIVTAGTGTPSTLTINATSGISGTGSVVAATLTAQVTGVGDLTLNNVLNNVSGTVNLQTFDGNISYADADVFTLGTITANGTNRNVSLNVNSAATITQSGVITATGGLDLAGAGVTYTLGGANNITGNLTGNTGTVYFNDATGGFGVGNITLAPITGLLTLKSNGTVTQAGGTVINTPGLELLGSSTTTGQGVYTLTGANTIGTIAANTWSLKLNDLGGLAIGSLNGTGIATNGIRTGGDTILLNNGLIDGTAQPIIAAGLKVSNGANAITLTNPLNNVTTLNLITTGADIAYTDANGFAIAAIDGSTYGIDTGNITTNNVTLLATGAVTQTNTTTNDKIRANILNIDTQNAGTISLLNTSNDVAFLNLFTQDAGATKYDIYYVDANSFSITNVDAGTGFASLISGGILSITAPPANVTAGSLEIGASNNLTIAADMTGLNALTVPTTFTAGYGTGTGKLIVSFPVETTIYPLTLKGDGIDINAAVTAGGGSTLTLENTASALTPITTGGGSLTTTGILNVNVTGTAGGAITLDGANDVGTLNITYRGGAVSFADANGFVLGSTGIVNATTPTVAAVQNVTLNVTNGSVTEPGTGVIMAAGLDLIGGANAVYTLGGNNDLTGNLTGNAKTVYFNDVLGGFGVGNITLDPAGLLTLKSNGTVLQAGGTVINTPGLELLGDSATTGAGAYTLAGANTVGTLAADTWSLKLNNTVALDINTLNGTGTATNGITTGGDTILSNTGAIVNTEKITVLGATAGLKVDATAGAGVAIDLSNAANNVTNLNLLTNGANITYVDADGVNIAAIDGSTEGINTADAVSLISITAKGDVTQNAVAPAGVGDNEILGGTLTVVTTGAAVGGMIDLSTEINDTATINLTSVSGQPISYKDANDFTITGLNAGTGLITLYYGQTTPTGAIIPALNLGGSLTVYATGDVTQTGAITLPSATGVLTVDTTGAGAGTGAITLDTSINEAFAVNLVSANGTDIAYKDGTALVVNGLNSGAGNAFLTIQGLSGNISQTAVINANTLTIDTTATSTGSGQIQLGLPQLNTVNNIDFKTSGSTVDFSAAGGLAILALDTATAGATITAGAGVTQGSAINTTGLLTVNSNGVIQLDSFANTVGSVSLSSGGANIFFWDADGVIVGGAGINSGVGSTTLMVAGPVSQGASSPILANALTVDTTTGAASTSTIDLSTAANNAVSVSLQSNASAISYNDADAVQITLLDSGTASSIITAAGTVTQSATPIVAGLLTVGTTAGGAINLATAANTAGSVSLSTANSAISYDAATSVVIAGISSGTGAVTITTNGDVTQSGAIVGGALTVDATGALAGGAITLGSANDAASISLTSANNGSVTFVDSNNIVVNGIAAGTGAVSVTAAGEINGTGTLTGSSVALSAAAIGLNFAATVDPVAYLMTTTPTIDAPLLSLTITGAGVTGAGEQWGGFMRHSAALVSDLDVTVNASVFVMVGAWKLPLFMALTAGGTLSGFGAGTTSAVSSTGMLASSTNAAASDALSNAAYFSPESYKYGDYEPDVTGDGASAPECMSLKKGKTRKTSFCVSASN